MIDDLTFAADFPAATREQWLTLVDKALKGAPFEKKLVHATYDGLRIEPLYQRAHDATAIASREPAAPWQVVARVDHPDPAEANKQALDDLENGATALSLVCPGSVGSYGYGIDGSADGIARILDNIYLDGIGIEFSLTREAKDVPAHIGALLKRAGIAPKDCDLRASYDPLGLMAAGASRPAPWDQIAPIFAGMISESASQGFRGPFAVADGRPVHAAGGSEAQELAFVLGNALAYLRALESAGITLADARRMIFFRLAADADQFLTMAKFRALRKLWARVEEACGLTPEPAFVSAETAWRMMTARDPYVNMLRVTIATFAAGLGGANAISVLPFTQALGLPDAFARRIARNTQLILLEESNLAKVTDPAAGSGGMEALTDELRHSAWTLFQEIEAAGGAYAALTRGVIQQKVTQTRAARERAIATRKDPLTGTSEFPHLAEAEVKVLDVKPLSSPTPLASSPPPLAGEVRRPQADREGAPSPTLPRERGRENASFAALPSIRLAEPYEALRDASDAILKKTGARPKIFLANLGKSADFIARAMFARNFFEAGGIETVEGNGDAAALAANFKQSGAKLACLCSSDVVYAAHAAEAAKALADAGAAHIYLAGRPGDLEPALKQAGVKSYIHAGCDALSTLRAAHDILGLK